jgi:hypothetical protein
MRDFFYLILLFFGTKKVLRLFFDFLLDKGFSLTIDNELVIPEWKINGIAYTNGKYVIVFSDDIREKRFVTLFYKIQKDKIIPIHFEKKYFSLENYLTSFDNKYSSEYKNLKGLLKLIRNTNNILKYNLNQIFLTMED